MSLTDRDRKLMLALIPVLVLVVYWFLVLAPKRSDATAAKDELTTQQARLDTARHNLQTAQGAKENFDASYAQVVKLGKAIPTSVDMPSLLVQLDAAAAGTGIRFTKIKAGPRTVAAVATTATPAPAAGSESGTTGTPVAAGGETAQSQPGGAAEAANNAQATSNQSTAAAENSGVNPSDTQTSTTAGATDTGTGATSAAAPAGLETVPLELEFQGNFFNLADFFHRVKRFVSLTNDNVVVSGRLVTVEGIRWSSDEAIFPKIRAEITATVYLSPKAQGATAGATPTGPSTTTPAGTTPTDGTTPTSAPTATATP
jgi:Type II secretion system (T2SS), protein M